MVRLACAIDRFTERSALLFAWLMVPLLVAVGWEVVQGVSELAKSVHAWRTGEEFEP